MNTPLFPEVPGLPAPPVSPVQAADGGGFWSNFLQSALRSGTSEMVGLPGEWTGDVGRNDAWRNENLVSSIASQILGAAPSYVASAMAAPYVAGTSAVARTAPWLGRLFSTDALLARPIATTTGRAVAETVPVTTARLLATPLLGGDLEQVAASAGMDLAGAALLGGAWGFGRSLRAGAYADDVERSLARQIEGYNQTDPLQTRLETLITARPNFTDPNTSQLMDDTIAQLQARIRTEGTRMRNLGALEGMGEAVTRSTVNRLFNNPGSANPAFRSQVLAQGDNPRYFRTPEEWQAVVREAGLPDGWEQYTQYPRLITPLSEAETTRIGTNLRTALTDVGNGWFVRREANQDIFVVARQLPAEGADQPRWFIARTNKPEHFIPTAPGMRRGERLARFLGQAEDDALGSASRAMPEGYVMRNDVERDAAWPLMSRTIKARWDMTDMMPSVLTQPTKEFAPVVGRTLERMKGVISPAIAQFRSAPLAQWMMSRARAVFQDAQGRARHLLFGELSEGGSAARQVMRGMRSSGGVRTSFEAVERNWTQDFPILQRFWAGRLQGVERGEALDAAFANVGDAAQRQRIRQFVDDLAGAQQRAFAEVQATQKAVGAKVTPEAEHWDIPHVWRGEYRQRVLDDRGRLQWVSGGNTPREAYNTAKAYADQHGFRLDPRGPFGTQDYDEDAKMLLELVRTRRQAPDTRVGATAPSNLERRQKTPIGGYLGDPNAPMPTAAEFWRVVERDIQSKYTHIASLVVNRRYAQDLLGEVVKRYGVETGSQLARRFNDMLGRQTEFSRYQNKVMSVLSPALGPNSASKIAGTMNAVETHFQLFFGNMGYVAANAVNFLQTVAPKIALMRQMIARGEGDRAMALYDFHFTLGQNGVQGAVASLSPLKLARAAFRDLMNPNSEQMGFFRQAVREGVLAPKMYDDYLGETHGVFTSVRAMMRGEEPISNGLRAIAGLNSAVPIKVEEMTRAHTFMTGLRMGEVVGLQGEARYQFAKQFSHQTMYGYSQADRPRLFTGPMGMVFGLFKNWMFHYASDFLMYGRETLRGNYQGLLWATTGTAAIGGIGGVPLYALVDSFQKMFTNRPIMEELYGATGENVGDALFYGVPGMLGISLQGSASAPFNDPVRDITFLTNVAALQRAQRIGTLLGEGWSMWARGGINPLESDRTWDLASYALGPRTFYKAMAQVEDGALRSIRNGRPIIEGITPLEAGLNTIGLTPTRIARAWEASESLWNDQSARRARTSQYAEVFYQAQQMGDSRAMGDVIARAVESQVDLSAVMQGAMLRQRNQLLPQMPFDYLRMPEGRGIERLSSLGLLQ